MLRFFLWGACPIQAKQKKAKKNQAGLPNYRYVYFVYLFFSPLLELRRIEFIKVK